MKVGLILTGCGEGSIAIIGALRALEENGIEADFLCAAGGAALPAALLSAGYTTWEMEHLIEEYLSPLSKRKGFQASLPLLRTRKAKTNPLSSNKRVEKILERQLERVGARHMAHTAIPLLLTARDFRKPGMICYVSDRKNFINGGGLEFVSNALLKKAALASMLSFGCDVGGVFDHLGQTVPKTGYDRFSRLLRQYGAERVIALHASSKGDAADMGSAPELSAALARGADCAIEIDTYARLSDVKEGNICRLIKVGHDTVAGNINEILISIYLKS